MNKSGCFECGSSEHFRAACPKLTTIVCQFCKKPGHTIEKCFKKAKTSAAVIPGGHFKAVLGGQLVNWLIDTGSEVSLLRKSILLKTGLKYTSCCQLLQGFSGHQIWTQGKVETFIILDNVDLSVSLLVLDDENLIEEGILGRDFLFKSNFRLLIGNEGIKIEAVPQLLAINATEEVDFNSELVDEADRQKLKSIILEFSDIIVTGTHVRPVTCGELFIRLSDDNPVVQSPYRLSFHERDIVRGIVADLIQNNIIQESVSPYASPITLVTKKNGQSRMCVDFRALNKITVKDRYPLPLIDDQLDALATPNGLLHWIWHLVSIKYQLL